MSCTAYLVADGPVRTIGPDEAFAYQGPGFVWTHIEGRDEVELARLRSGPDPVPGVAASALVAHETRPRCDRIGDGALINLRGPAAAELDDSDRLVSIRFWVRERRVVSVSRRPLLATADVAGVEASLSEQAPSNASAEAAAMRPVMRVLRMDGFL